MSKFMSKIENHTCRLCRKESIYVSKTPSLCSDCIKNKEESLEIIKKSYATVRDKFSLPAEPPKNKGVKCNICSNECSMGDGDIG